MALRPYNLSFPSRNCNFSPLSAFLNTRQRFTKYTTYYFSHSLLLLQFMSYYSLTSSFVCSCFHPRTSLFWKAHWWNSRLCLWRKVYNNTNALTARRGGELVSNEIAELSSRCKNASVRYQSPFSRDENSMKISKLKRNRYEIIQIIDFVM